MTTAAPALAPPSMGSAPVNATAPHLDRLRDLSPDALVARIDPKRPKGSPARVTFPWLADKGERRFFSEDDGFVPVSEALGQFLRSIHCDGEPAARGGRGPKLFEVMTAKEAVKTTVREQRDALLDASKGNKMIAGWSGDALDGIMIDKSEAERMRAEMATMQRQIVTLTKERSAPPVVVNVGPATPVTAEQGGARAMPPIVDAPALASTPTAPELEAHQPEPPPAAPGPLDVEALHATLSKQFGEERADAMIEAMLGAALTPPAPKPESTDPEPPPAA